MMVGCGSYCVGFFVWEEDLVGEYNGVLSNVVSQVDNVDK
jgi:hypothetical protein